MSCEYNGTQNSIEWFCLLDKILQVSATLPLSGTVAATQNYIGVYIIMDCLQALVNNLLVWQSSCKSKLCPLNSKFISPAACRCLACTPISKSGNCNSVI